MERKTRIVATLGPATDRPGVLETILETGLDVARVNFSHGSPEEHKERVDRLRRLAAHRSRPLAILGDLPGPKLRALLSEPIELTPGQDISLGRTNDAGDIKLTEPELLEKAAIDQRILLDDGRLQLRVTKVTKEVVVATVVTGGKLLPNKGVNLPDTPLTIEVVTPRDRAALAIAAEVGVDWLALSFVRAPYAADELRATARSHGLSVPIMAKIERPEAVRCATELVETFDGIMVARGDLGVEIPLQQVPQVQKKLINHAREAGKPVVTATDMLDSMRSNPRPTRAEASDVANAVYDGTDAIMLSGETAIGDYPVEAVKFMDLLAREAESHIDDEHWRELYVPRGEIRDHITHMTCELAHEIHAQAIITPTDSGRTPRMVARHRPNVRMIAPAPDENVMRQLAMSWGVTPVFLDRNLVPEGADRLEADVEAAFRSGAVKEGERVIVVAGHPLEGSQQGLPTVRVVRIGPGGKSIAP
ncbi:MAG: pyruvate kinase [Gemmataceae bacterium]